MTQARVRQTTAIVVAGREIDLVQEGHSSPALYLICEVLHRNERGMIDHYRRLFAYGWQRSKRDAVSVLAQIERDGFIKSYKEPRQFRRRKYWVHDTGSYQQHFYRIEVINNPYYTKERQVRTVYRGLEPEAFSTQYGPVAALAQKLDDAYWQQEQAGKSKMIEIVDRRPVHAR